MTLSYCHKRGRPSTTIHDDPRRSTTIFQDVNMWNLNVEILVKHTEPVSLQNPTARDPGSDGMALPAWLTADAKLVYAPQLRWIWWMFREYWMNVWMNVVEWHAVTCGDGLKMFEACTCATVNASNMLALRFPDHLARKWMWSSNTSPCQRRLPLDLQQGSLENSFQPLAAAWVCLRVIDVVGFVDCCHCMPSS